MEEILKQILTKLDVLEIGQVSMQKDIRSLKEDNVSLKEDNASLKEDTNSLKKGQANLQKGQANLQKGQDAIALEQAEMRKEVAFYYGSMMKKLDETKHELSSEMKQFGKIQKEHQHVLQFINEKQ
jgi:chromosome segregation ATPase